MAVRTIGRWNGVPRSENHLDFDFRFAFIIATAAIIPPIVHEFPGEAWGHQPEYRLVLDSTKLNYSPVSTFDIILLANRS